ncbi:hypothetical protein D9M71_340080 [compost metagenome]
MVHICPEYRLRLKARLRAAALRSRTLSMMTLLTPAFSVNTWAWRAFSSSQLPKVLEPVKSTSLTRGSRASTWLTGASALSTTRLTSAGSKPSSPSTSCATLTLIATGRIAAGCGLTSTGLPVARLANRPG